MKNEEFGKASRANSSVEKLCRDGKSVVKNIYDGNGDLRKVELYYPDGHLRVSYEYANGVKNGLFTGFSKTGRLNTKCTYVDNALDGEYWTFFASGRVKVHAHYERGKLHGKFVEYDKDGREIADIMYHHGVKHGPEIIATDKHEIVKSEYSNGDLCGIRKRFRFNRLVESQTFRDGYLDAKSFVFFDDYANDSPIIEYERDYSGMGRLAKVVRYNKSGAVIMSCTELDGERDGQYMEYYGNGNVKITCTYKKGRLTGLKRYYSASGELKKAVDHGE